MTPRLEILGDPAATYPVDAVDESGARTTVLIAGEFALTLYLDKRELVTLMTLGTAAAELAIGYLRNQRLIASIDDIASVQVDWSTNSVAVTSRPMARDGVSLWECDGQHVLDERLRRRTVTSGCGQGTVFGALVDDIDRIVLADDIRLDQAGLYRLLEAVRRHDSVYKAAGAVHGCALFRGGTEQPELLRFVEDVGRHNAVDAIAGWMWLAGEDGGDKLFYTTGRLTSEMVIKCAQMGVPILVSRSGLTRMGHEIAARLRMTMFGRCQGRHYLLFTGEHRFTRPVLSDRKATQ